MAGDGTVSVVIPFFNAADTLARALRSVAQQTLPAFEVIVVNDASAAAQRAEAQRIAGGFANVRVLDLPSNGGPAVARNRGIDAAGGEFVAFLDSDDYWLPEKLEHAVTLMRDKAIDFLGHNNIVAGSRAPTINDRLHRGAPLYRMNRLDVYIATSQFAPTTVVFRKGRIPVRFDETIRRSEDYRLWGELVFRGYPLWKSTAFLSVRDEGHIKGRGLSGNVQALLDAHLATVRRFRADGHIGAWSAALLGAFLKAKYLRHR